VGRGAQPHSSTTAYHSALGAGAGAGAGSGFDASLAPGVAGQAAGGAPSMLGGAKLGGAMPVAGGAPGSMAGHTSTMGGSGVQLHGSQVRPWARLRMGLLPRSSCGSKMALSSSPQRIACLPQAWGRYRGFHLRAGSLPLAAYS